MRKTPLLGNKSLKKFGSGVWDSSFTGRNYQYLTGEKKTVRNPDCIKLMLCRFNINSLTPPKKKSKAISEKCLPKGR